MSQAKKADLERAFLTRWIQLAGDLPAPKPQYRLIAEMIGKGRGFRARLADYAQTVPFEVADWPYDFAWPGHNLLVEIQGGTFTRGAHSRGVGQHRDFNKHNAAISLGWVVLFFDTVHINDKPNQMIDLVKFHIQKGSQL